ncbi:MAG: sulfatase, partial [Candidatus Krumholzibacteriia bacterium]
DLPHPGCWRAVVRPAVLCGGAALAAALFVFPAAGVVWRRARRPRRVAFGVAVAGGAASLLVVWAAYVLRERLVPAWWSVHGGVLGKGVLGLLWLGLVGLGSVVLRPVASGLARRRAWLLLGPLLLATAGALAWPHWRTDEPRRRTAGLARSEAPPPGAPNVVLLTIDAWRRDHLSCVNPAGPPTPHLDALAGESMLFTNAWTPCPWTLPAVGALLTGLPPAALDLRQYRALPAAAGTLAATAWSGGWATAAFVTNPYLSRWYGFDRGFAAFEHSLVLEPLEPAERCVLAREVARYADLHFDAAEAGVVMPKALSWLRRHGRERPFFLWIHLLDPHLPYTWHELPDPPAPAPAAAVRGVAPLRADVPDTGFFRGRSFGALHAVRSGAWKPDAGARRAIAALYAREVQYADAWAGRLFDELRRSGLLDRSLVIVTADHGEELFDHGGIDHGHSLLPEVTGVPLIVRFPDGTGRGSVSAEQVSLLDVAPTVAAALGWPASAGAVGRNLAPAPAAAPRAAPLVMENLLYGPPQVGWLRWPWLDVGPEPGDRGVWYDLAVSPRALAPAAAPADADSLVTQGTRLREGWRRLAGVLRAAEPVGRAGAVPDDVRRQLRSLGY